MLFVPPVLARIRLEGLFCCVGGLRSAFRSSCARRNTSGGVFCCVGGLQSAFRSFCVINHGPEAVMCVSRMVLSGAKAHQRRAGREERCDDREAPDGAKRNRHAPGGSCEAAGEDRVAGRAGFRSLRSRYPGGGVVRARMQPDDFVISGCFISCPYVSKLPTGTKQNSPARCARLHPCFAERAGFEPANPFGRSRAFQTRLFSHSSTSPCGLRVQI